MAKARGKKPDPEHADAPKPPPQDWIRRYVVLLLGAILAFALVGMFTGPDNDGGPPILVYVFLAAILGSAANLSSGMKRFPQLDTPRDQVYFLAWKMLIAIVFALFLFVGFMSGTITGTLFPEFQSMESGYSSVAKLMQECKPSSNSDAAKMFLWAFIAGYLERFVPNLIMTTYGGAEKR